MPVSQLSDRGVLRVAGEATAFLHRVITNSVLNFSPGEARFSALLSPQGKLLFDFFVVPLPEGPEAGYYFDCARTQAADLAKRINLHKLRAKVSVEDLSETFSVAAAWDGATLSVEQGTVYADPRAENLGQRVIAPRAMIEELGSDEPAYEAHRVAHGVPKGGVDFPYGDSFVHDANLDVLHGVDFKKGCYVGQEVVARVHYRKSARKRVLKVRFEGPPPAVGTEVTAGEIGLGQIGSVAGDEGLALLRLDRVEEMRRAGTPIMAGAVGVRVCVPPEFLPAAAGVEKRL